MTGRSALVLLMIAGLLLTGASVFLFLAGDDDGELDLLSRPASDASSPNDCVAGDLPPAEQAEKRVPVESRPSSGEETRAGEPSRPTEENRTKPSGPTGVVSGRVTDRSLQPVAGTKVFVTEYSGPEAESRLEELRRRGAGRHGAGVPVPADGFFRLDGVPAGTIRVWAGAEGMFHSHTDPIDVRANEEVAGVDLVLDPFGPEDTISGTVVSPDGEGVKGARVDAFYRTEIVDGVTTVFSGEGGRFVCLVEEKVDHVFTAEDRSGRFSPVSLAGVAPGARNVVLRLAPLRTMRVRVRTTGGAAVPFYEVWVASPGPRDEISGNAFSTSCFDTEGAVAIAVPEAPFHFRVLVRDCRIATLGPLLPADLPEIVDVTVVGLPAVSGRVVDRNGAPIPGARVSLEEVFGPGEMRVRESAIPHRPRSMSCSTGTDGSFAIHFERAGRFYLHVRSSRHQPVRIEPRFIDGEAGESGIEIVLSEARGSR